MLHEHGAGLGRGDHVEDLLRLGLRARGERGRVDDGRIRAVRKRADDRDRGLGDDVRGVDDAERRFTARAKPEATKVLDVIASPEARAVFAKHGFLAPGS